MDQDQLETIIAKFPDQGELIRNYYDMNPKFARICQDYLETRKQLADWMEEANEAEKALSGYREILIDLLKEIQAYLLIEKLDSEDTNDK